MLGYGLLHTLLASSKIKAQSRRWFGEKTDRVYRIAYNFIAVFTLLPILLLPILLVDEEIYRIHLPWVIVTLSVQALSIIILVVGLRQTGLSSFIGIQQLLLPEDTSPPRLITNGLYRYVRHPLYSCGLVFIWLIPIMTWNLLALLIGLTAYIIVGAYFEERKLLIEFGSAYAEYRQRTPMLFPGVKFSPRKH